VDGNGNGGVRRGPKPLVTVGGQEAAREGAVEERVWHSGVDEGDGWKKGGTTVADTFYAGPVARAKRKKGRGFGVRCCVEGKTGKRERAPGAVGDSSAAGISVTEPPQK
jgi:hypothetical protein